MDSSNEIIPIIQTAFETVMASTTLSFLVGFLGLYCLVLFADIILLFMLRAVGGDLKKGFFGTKERPLTSSRRLLKEWKSLEARLASGQPSEYKVALLEADAFVNKVLSEMGYEGKDAGERFSAIPPGHFSGLGGLIEAHEIHNRIVHERDFSLEQSEATRILSLYRDVLEEAEIFS
ncbi:MAG: hypothetical protein IPJ67_02840 [Candidatus Moraniibacteriota bacterium]|nr:MAG: hypothetical protein IPJ67_02840 [Candidatus Moranbacteria bacterium]